MTQASTPLRAVGTGNSVTENWPYGWMVEDETHLKVTKVTIATNVEETLTVNSDYTVTGVGVGSGYVVITPAISNAYRLVITPNLPEEQEIDFTNENSVPPERVELGLDRCVRLVKQLSEKVARAVLVPVGSIITPEDYLEELTALKDAAEAAQAGAETAQGLSETAQAASEAARDEILNDSGFIAVAADLEGANTIGAVAAIAADVTTVAGINAETAIVAGIAANVTTVAGIAANVTTVAGIAAAVSTVSGIAAAVSNVSSISAAVSTVSGISANVTTVAGIASAVSTVASINAAVSAVAVIAADVTTVSTNIADVQTCATNIAAIIAAPGYASAASDSADLAQLWAEEAEDVEVTPGHYSAYHWAQKAADFAAGAAASITFDDTGLTYITAANVQDALEDVDAALVSSETFGKDFKDEDDMASNSATAVPSQQSVKAYVDSAVGGGGATFTQIGSTLNPSGTASASFTSIPSGHAALLLVYENLSTDTTNPNTLVFEMDAGGGLGSEAFQTVIAQGGSGTQSFNNGGSQMGSLTNQAISANSNGSVLIPLYDKAILKQYYICRLNNSSATGDFGHGFLHRSAAIVGIRCTLGSAGNFDGATAFKLYGVNYS